MQKKRSSLDNWQHEAASANFALLSHTTTLHPETDNGITS